MCETPSTIPLQRTCYNYFGFFSLDGPVFNVTAFDKDEGGTANSQVAYSLVSQTPRLKEPIFTVDSSSGLIRISGCSDYEV